MKDAARLLGYFGATILFGALVAPVLYWIAQWFSAHGLFQALAVFDFETYFHRALLIGAILFLWPFLRSAGIRSREDLGLTSNPRWARDMGVGFLLSALPVLCFAMLLVIEGFYTVRPNIRWSAVASVGLTAVAVPFIEEALFRGLFLGVLIRKNTRSIANLLGAAIYSIVHFLKAPDRTSQTVEWTSGFRSVVHAFDQFGEPMLVLAGFTTLLIIGLILGSARLQTRSLWLPIGLHAGWILASSTFSKIAQREILALPWLGKNLLIGIAPLCVCFITWLCLRGWLNHVNKA